MSQRSTLVLDSLSRAQNLFFLCQRCNYKDFSILLICNYILNKSLWIGRFFFNRYCI